MYTKQEASRQRQAFWTTFGRYMQPVLSADGEKTNWINYKTGKPGIYFKMDADNKRAGIAIEIAVADDAARRGYYEQFVQLKEMLHETLGEGWTWQQDVQDEYGKTTSRIGKEITGVNINNNEQWPELISFFKPRIIALDAFWGMAKYGFEVGF